MGSWQVLPYTAPILPINAVLMHTGKVLMFAGSGNDPTQVGTLNNAAVWDPVANSFFSPTAFLDSNGNVLDLFCAGNTVLPDGTVLVVGGTIQYDPFYGLPTALVFDPTSQSWLAGPTMSWGRWYPTLVLFPNGRVLAVSGFDQYGDLVIQPELCAANPTSSTAINAGWSLYPSTISTFAMYSHMFLLSNGKVFFSGGVMDVSNGVWPTILTMPSNTSQQIAETVVPGLDLVNATNQAASVLLPPAQNQRFMLVGGSDTADGVAVNRVGITTKLTISNPSYTAGPPLNYARMHTSAVILPDRTVLVCNGSSIEEHIDQSMLPAEIYNPATNTWTVVEAQTVPRVYHSIALLLPDGRVLTAGGNPDRGWNELRLEIYSPSYMSKARPVIQSMPSNVTYGQSVTISTPQAKSIKWVNLMRPCAQTHSLDTDQRLVDLPITSRTSSTLTVTVPTNKNLALPGWYMVFLTTTNNVPSVASWVKLA